MDRNMQFTINSFRQLFPDKIFSLTVPWFSVKSPTFPWQLSNSLIFPGFPDKWSPWMQTLINSEMIICLHKIYADISWINLPPYRNQTRKISQCEAQQFLKADCSRISLDLCPLIEPGRGWIWNKITALSYMSLVFYIYNSNNTTLT